MNGYIADLYDGLPYNFYTLDFESINKAYADESTNEYLFSSEVYMFKIKNDYKERPIDVEYIKLRLEDFLNSVDTTDKLLRAERFIGNGFTYGLAYYDELINDISVGRLDVRTMHMVCDYMKMMKYKLDAFKQNRIISEDEFERINLIAEKLLAQVTAYRNLYLKKRMTNSANTSEFTNKLICSYQQVKQDNKEFVEKIFAVI